MATDYYSWEKMTLHATSENGRTADLAVRLGPSHRRWLIVGHTETMNRDELFAYVERRLLRGERLVHLGKEPLLTFGKKLTKPDGTPNPDPNPPYTLPFRIVDKQYGSPPTTFYKQELVVQFTDDDRIITRSMSSKAVLPLAKLYPWVKSDEQLDAVPYYVGAHARYSFPGKGNLSASTPEEFKEFKDFLDKLLLPDPEQRKLSSQMSDLVPMFPHNSPVLTEMADRYDEIQKKAAKSAETHPLMKGVIDNFNLLLILGGQMMHGSQDRLNLYSPLPELSDAPTIYAQDAVDHTSHMVQVDQLLRGVRLSNCSTGQRVNPEAKFVQELLATKTQTAHEELLAAESQWVAQASSQFLQLIQTHRTPDQITNYRKALLDVREWLLAGGITTWDALNSIANDTPGGAAATLVIRNTTEAPGHRVYFWPLLGAAVVGCNHRSHTREELNRQLFAREVLGIEPKAEAFNGLTPSTFVNRIGQTWSNNK